MLPDDLWWLTELQRTQPPEEKAEAQQGDEDGPNSSDGAEEQVNDDSTDDDGDSTDVEQEEISGAQSAYPGFFERQREAKCGMHALNNAIGRRQGGTCAG